MEALMTPKNVVESNLIPLMTENNLAQLRYTGNGPAYVKLGKRVYYRARDISEWIDANTRTSTAA